MNLHICGLMLGSLIAFVSAGGCSATHAWYNNLPAPSKGPRLAPVAIAVVVVDDRPQYDRKDRVPLALLPLVPFAGRPIDRGTGSSWYRGPGGEFGAQADMDFKDVVPLLVAHGIRSSNCVLHAGCEDGAVTLKQYEVVLELRLNDACHNERMTFCGLSLAYLPFWYIGFPMGWDSARVDLNWRLYAQSSGEEFGKGHCAFTGSKWSGVYHGDPSLSLMRLYEGFMPDMVGKLVDEVRHALRLRPADYWTALVSRHEEWRIAKGDFPPYKPAFSEFKAMAAAWRTLPMKPDLPEDTQRYRAQGEEAFRNRDYAKALYCFERGLGACPLWPDGHLNAAELCAELQQYGKAVWHMKRYLELRPDTSETAEQREKMYIWEGKLSQ